MPGNNSQISFDLLSFRITSYNVCYTKLLRSDCLSENKSDSDTLINAVSGNICRCTGYKSIERAASEIAAAMREKDQKDPVRWLVSQNSLPGYFLTILV